MSDLTQKLPSKIKKNLSPYLVHLVIIAVLITATIIINSNMIRYGLNGTGDLRWHIGWVQHFSKQLGEGIWYPRWLAGTNFGYGSPTMVFYPPLIYYLGAAFKFIGFNIEQTMTILMSLGIFLSGLTFYIYGCYKWGKLPALVGALFYMTTPGIIIYTNGGVLANLFALAWIPLGTYLTDRAIIEPKWRIPLAILWTLVALTHTPSLLLWAIAWLFYTLFSLTKHSGKAILGTLFSAVIGWSMASAYILPALLEKSFVNIDYPNLSKGGFKTLNLLQLFQQGISDITIRQLLGIIVLAVICLIINRQKPEKNRETWGWLAFIGLVLFFISNLSLPIWNLSGTLRAVQTSWRLGGLFYFGEAGLCGLAVSSLLQLRSYFRIFPAVIIASIILMNFKYGYRLTRTYPALHSPGKGEVFVREWLEIALYDPYSDKLIDVPEYRPLLNDRIPSTYPREGYSDAGIPYLKNGSPSFPIPVIGQPRVSVLSGQAEVEVEQWESYERKLKVTVQQTSTIRLRVYNYPAWHLYVNNKPDPIEQADDGTISFKLEPGFHEVNLRYQWTPAFTIGVILSLLSVAVGIFLGIRL